MLSGWWGRVKWTSTSFKRCIVEHCGVNECNGDFSPEVGLSSIPETYSEPALACSSERRDLYARKELELRTLLEMAILQQLRKGRSEEPPFLWAFTLSKWHHAAFFCALLAASFSFSALIAGANCAITESRLNEAAFWRGGYLTKLSIWAATIACAP
jgi:hypothetical protein